MAKFDFFTFCDIVTQLLGAYILSVISDKISEGLKERHVLY